MGRNLFMLVEELGEPLLLQLRHIREGVEFVVDEAYIGLYVSDFHARV